MHENLNIHILLVLLIMSAAVAMTVKRIKLPYSIALVIVGLISGLFHLLPDVEMSPELVMLVFLPALLFEASWNIELDVLRRNWVPISVLATVGVLISMAAVAAGMHLGAGFALGPAFLFGAMVSATDPISVLALFRKLGMNERLTMILEGESLFNDGTAVVMFNLVLAIVVAGTSISPASTVGSFLFVVAGGAAIGCTLGYIASKITSFFEDHLLEITLTTILAYGSYLVADQAKVSAVISVVAAGIVMGNFGSRTSMSPTTRLAVNSFWEYAAFVVNSLLFLLIGLQVKFHLLVLYAKPIGIGVVSILVARLLVVYGICPLFGKNENAIPWKWRHLLFWGALRGSLSMALALSLPRTLESREAIIITTFGVVLFTLLVPGLTVQPLVGLLKMIPRESQLERYRELKAQSMANQASIESLQRMLESGSLSKQTYDILYDKLRNTQQELQAAIDGLHLNDSSIQQIELADTSKKLLEAKKDFLVLLRRQGAISDETLHKLKVELDRELSAGASESESAESNS